MAKGKPAIDPVEDEVRKVLDLLELTYVRDAKSIVAGEIDFFIPELDLFIECCRFGTDRKIKQIGPLQNVMLVQGLPAAQAFAKLLNQAIDFGWDLRETNEDG